MELLEKIAFEFAAFVWGLPLLILLIGGGLFLLLKSGFIQFKYLFHAIDLLRGKYNRADDPGEISHFQALSTALAATVGMGNIAGVAVAISIGGPGAIFWMWISGIIGMSTKFFTCTLAVLYRGRDSADELQGGPMYFITEGLGKKWRPMAVFFSIAGLVGALPVFNVNQLTQAIRHIYLIPNQMDQGFYSDLWTGIILLLLTAVVVLGGLKRISQATARMVPLMVALYFFSVLIILFVHLDQVPYYFGLIFKEAFNPTHYKGSPLLGGMLGGLILLGIRRGAFSNEAGIGTAPMAHGAARTSEPVREGLVAMMGPAIDTLFVCTLTALAILVTGVWQSSDLNGVSLTAKAFSEAMPGYGNYLLLICIFIFSISSLFSYSYYGTKCMSFLFGAHNKKYYNYIYLGSILLASVATLEVIINLVDGFFALMAIPTMTATLLLSSRVKAEAKKYFSKLNSKKAERSEFLD